MSLRGDKAEGHESRQIIRLFNKSYKEGQSPVDARVAFIIIFIVLHSREKPKSKGKIYYYFEKFICDREYSCADWKLEVNCDTYPGKNVQMDRVQIGARREQVFFNIYAMRGELIFWGIISC